MNKRLLAAGSASLGESPLWPSAAIIASAVLYADLPTRFIAGSSAGAFSVVRWVVPALTAVLLAALLLTLPGGRLVQAMGWVPHQVHVTRHWLSLAMIAIVSAANSRVDRSARPPAHQRRARERADAAARGRAHVGRERAAVRAVVLAARRRRPGDAADVRAARARLPLPAADGAGADRRAAGGRCSSTTSSSRSRTRPRSARPTRCRSAAGRRCSCSCSRRSASRSPSWWWRAR